MLLRAARKSRKVSVKEAAAALDLSVASYRQREEGYVKIQSAEIVKLADMLDVNPDRLLAALDLGVVSPGPKVDLWVEPFDLRRALTGKVPPPLAAALVELDAAMQHVRTALGDLGQGAPRMATGHRR